MRIIHTSDWHLGQYFYGKSRAPEHRRFADWLAQQVREFEVDAVIVAGDIFDTGAPPSYARQLYADMLTGLHDSGCTTIILAGNHDSVSVLNETAGLVGRFGSHVVSSAADHPEDQLLVLRNKVGEPLAIVCAVPFLRPRDIIRSEAGQSACDRQRTLQNAIVDHYRQLHSRALMLRDQLGGDLPIIATGHLTAVGANTSESVRDIYIGTLDALPVTAFPAADYIALGHIHRAQRIGDKDNIRYSGSPIPLSFDELAQPKSVVLAEFDARTLSTTQTLKIPVFQPLFTLTGSSDNVIKQLDQLPPTLTPDLPAWLSIEINQDDYPPDARRAVEAAAESLPVEVLLHRHQRSNARLTASSSQKAQLHELTPGDVFAQRLSLEPTEDPERLARLQGCFSQVLDELALKNTEDERELPSHPVQGELL